MSWKLLEEDGTLWDMKDGHTEFEDYGVLFRPVTMDAKAVDATWVTVWLPYAQVKRMWETL